MSTIETTVLPRSVSHSVELTNSGELDREQIYLTYPAKWRGVAVRVEMNADRYRHSDGVSEWRIYAGEAYTGENKYSGNELTPTARQRLGTEYEPHVREWLKSSFYNTSEVGAIVATIKHELNRPHYGMVDRAAVWVENATIQRKLGASIIGAMSRTIDAFNAYKLSLEKI